MHIDYLTISISYLIMPVGGESYAIQCINKVCPNKTVRRRAITSDSLGVFRNNHRWARILSPYIHRALDIAL